MLVRVCTPAVLCLLLTVAGSAQSRQAGGTAAASGGLIEAAALGRAWVLMSQGSYSAASAQAQELLRKNPRSIHALALAVESAIALQGPAAGLDQYERWLGSRSLEEPGVLRRVSTALLRDAARNPATRLAALQGLAADGDERAAAEMAALARKGGSAELRAMARLGDRGAARTLVAQLDRRDVDPARTIEAIGDSGYAPAVDALAVWLGDQRPEVRGAAADALGKLGEQSPAVVKMLTPLLSDGSSYVRTRTAAALYRLGDPAGTPWLQELAASEVPAGRMAAAEAMAPRPDAAWTALVTELATAGGAPDIRLRAARLLAPHDPDMARSIARELSGDPNPAVRELAGNVMSETASGEGLAVLRAHLRAASDLTRLQAATRILDLTR